jgi:RNA polymerase sigma factor (sigma-70 family)
MGMDVATQDTVVMPGTDDATLARAAQAGDPAGLGGLFERHRAHLYAVALGILGHGPDADDAVQDTIVIAMSKIGALRDPGAAGGWLVAILVNVCRARLRRPVREVAYTEAAEASGALDTVQETVERGALRDWVWTALDGLPQRVTVMLRHFSTANSYSAIADLCDVPIETVRSRLNAARRRLADQLLITVGSAYGDRSLVQGWWEATGNALQAFERTADARLLESISPPTSPSGWRTGSNATGAPS